MRRTLLAAVTLAACVVALAVSASGQDAAPDRPQKRVVLRVLTTADFPPFNYRDEEGQLAGFNVDLARSLCLELQVQCSIDARAWEDLLPALARREADAVFAGHLVTARALAVADFTDRYFHTPGRFAGKRGAQLDVSPEGLDGRTIGVAKGTSHAAYLQAFFRDSTIQTFESPELARDALVADQIDLLFDDGVALQMWVNGTLSKECCELKGGPYLEPKYFGDGMAIAVAKGDRDLKAQLNQAIKRMRASGRFEELVSRYFQERVY